MKNDAYCSDTYCYDTLDCGTFKKHNELTVEFEPCEVTKEFDVYVKMDDCSCPASNKPFPRCDENGCDNKLLLLLLVILLTGHSNLECGKN